MLSALKISTHICRDVMMTFASKGQAIKVVELEMCKKGSGFIYRFIEVPYTQGAQVRITQCYLQTTPYLPLPRKHSPDGASQTEVADI